MSPALRGLALAALLLLAPLGALAQTLTPSGDAHVRGGAAANNNYGGVVLLGVRTANNALNTYWSYLKFDTGGVSGVVREAKLRLLVALSSSGSVQTNLYAAPATWGETTITWNNKPALGAQLGSFTVANTGYVWFEMDVTGHVQAELAQGAVGFALANPAVSSQLVAVQSRESSNPAQLVLVMNTAPSVTLTSPANGATFTAPANITLTATAADADGTIQKVEFFHGGTNLIATVTAAPYTFDWTNVAAGSYSLTAKATDDLNGTATSAPVGITVSAAVGQLYFIHADHLNTPRLVADATATTVWRWDQAEPFANNPADENPSGLGAFDLPLRLPGQRYDKETGLHYNYFRDYDPSIGRYGESDPIGLSGGLNTYAYVGGQPLRLIDAYGLQGKSGTSNERCPPNSCQKKCLETTFGEPIDSIEVIVDIPMVTRHRGEGAKGSVTRENAIYTSLGCDGFWPQHFHVLHEYFHVIRQWGRGMTKASYLVNWRQKEREADAFAQDHLMEYIKCLSACSPQCKP